MAWLKRKKRSGNEAKFGNEKISLDGYSFGSKLEASVYQMLKLRMRAGEIQSIQVQDHIYLTRARIGYVPDFKCLLSNETFLWVEAKGFPNDRWPMKKKLWKHYGPGKLEIWAGTYKNPTLIEEIIPMPSEDEETIAHLRSKIEELTKELEDLKSKLSPAPLAQPVPELPEQVV